MRPGAAKGRSEPVRGGVAGGAQGVEDASVAAGLVAGRSAGGVKCRPGVALDEGVSASSLVGTLAAGAGAVDRFAAVGMTTGEVASAPLTGECTGGDFHDGHRTKGV
jgi:hypothetical protein